jgi:hypothetical protein
MYKYEAQIFEVRKSLSDGCFEKKCAFANILK